MQKYDCIAVILVYRNASDLEECLLSFQNKITSCKCVVINAHYDNESMVEIQNIAKKYNADFVDIENRGYSYGNNYGIAYVKKTYKYKYLIVSNPDILIQTFDINDLIGDIIAPKIVTLSGKNQNPMGIIENRISDILEYKGFLKDNKYLLWTGIGINKIIREVGLLLFRLRKKESYPIYAAHGSFVVFSEEAISKLYPVYDEQMFLFAEESVLAYKAKKVGIQTCYVDKISVKHKEDGSMNLADFSTNEELKRACIYYYSHYVFKGKE